MTKSHFSAAVLLGLTSLVPLGIAQTQDQQIDRKQLREMLVQLGYEVKDIVTEAGKEKYSVSHAKADLNIPIGYEISPSNSFIWLTVNLGESPKGADEKSLNLLKQNSKIQPTFFYVTDSGRLMAAMAIENRGVNNALLRQRSEFVAESVGKTKTAWQ